ncbi:MAG: MFS transporter [Bacillota bacterium]
MLFFVGWILMYANRTVLSPLLKPLGNLWSLSETQLGLLSSAFFLMYTLLQVPFGWLADRLGRRPVLVSGYLAHGIGATLCGLAPGPAAFLGLRILTGSSQGSYYSTQYALAADSIPAERRGVGMAVINSGMAFGIALGLAASGTLVYGLGLSWRVPFIVLGLVTLAVAGAMALLVRENRRPPASAVPAKSVPAVPPGPAARPASRHFHRNLIAACGASFVSMYGFYVILTWLPYYLQTARGFTGAQAGNISTLMAFSAVPGGILVGRLSDRIGGRRRLAVVLLPLAAAALAAIVAPGGPVFLMAALVLYGLTGKLVVDPLLVALVADATPPERYASAFGVLNFFGTTSMVLAPTITGVLAERTGSFAGAFHLAAVLSLLGLVFLAVARED